MVMVAVVDEGGGGQRTGGKCIEDSSPSLVAAGSLGWLVVRSSRFCNFLFVCRRRRRGREEPGRKSARIRECIGLYFLFGFLGLKRFEHNDGK